MLYDQTQDKYTRNACWIYAALNYFRYEYWVEIPDNGMIIKICEYFDRIWVWFENWGLDANIAYPALMLYIRYKTWFNLKIVKWSINKIDSKKGYVLWFKKASKLYLKLSKDKSLTKDDIMQIRGDKSWFWHFFFYKKETVVDSLGGFSYNLKYPELKYARDIDLFYNSVRQFVPADDRTERAQIILVGLAKNRKEFISIEELKTLNFK